jgi:hypothetical protein
MNDLLKGQLDSVKTLVERLQKGREVADQLAYSKQTRDDAERMRKVVESWGVEVNDDVLAGMLAAIVYERAAIRGLPAPMAHGLTAVLAGFGAVVVDLSERSQQRAKRRLAGPRHGQ